MTRTTLPDPTADQPTTAIRRDWPWWRASLAGLSLLALGLSAVLSWHYVTGLGLVGCGGGSPCDQVLGSRWSEIGGVPVSGIAAGVYLAIFVTTLSVGAASPPAVRRAAWRTLLLFAGAIVGGVAWFFFVQRFKLGVFCPYCLATHSVGLLIAAIVLWRAPRALAAALPPTSPAKTPLTPALVLSVLGVAFAGALALGQTWLAPAGRSLGGESGHDPTALNPRSGPLIGPPDARYVVELLFDYECPHCQQLHLMLDAAIRRYDGKLAFALRPVPLNSKCNAYVTHDTAQFADACELAKIALAVWLAKPDAFPGFDRWMFTHESGDFWRPRRVEAATAKAVELVGRAPFEAARADPRLERYLQVSVQRYGQTVQTSSAVPKLIYGSRWLVPAPQDPDDFVSLLQANLALPKP